MIRTHVYLKRLSNVSCYRDSPEQVGDESNFIFPLFVVACYVEIYIIDRTMASWFQLEIREAGGWYEGKRKSREYSWSGWLLCLKEYWREEQKAYSLIEIILVSCSFSQSLLCCKLAWFVIHNFNVNATVLLHRYLLLSVRLVGGRLSFISSSTYYSNPISKSIVYTLNCL